MANSIQGLRIKPSYEDLIGVAVSDGSENIEFHDRNALFLRNVTIRWGRYQNHGKQQDMTYTQAFKYSLLKDMAINTGANPHDLRS